MYTLSVTWTEIDSADTSPAETDIAFGPITTKTSIQGRMLVQLDNLPTQDPHYALIGAYFNEAKDEILTLGLGMGRQVLDQLPRLQNWRWADATIAGQGWLPLPERMLFLEALSYSKSLAAYDPSTTQLLPASPSLSAEQFDLMSRTQTGYPTIFRRSGARVEFWPTPSTSPTDFRTQVVLYGTRMDRDLSGPTDTLLMSPRLQLLTIDLAVAITMEKMGWDEAEGRRERVEAKLGRLIGIGMKESVNRKITTRVAGTP